MIILQPNINYTPPIKITNSGQTAISEEEFGVTEPILNELEFGSTHYRFLQNITIRSIRDYESGNWICWSSDLPSTISGNGDCLESAQNDFQSQLHATFQQLYCKRPFEMTELEQQQWQQLVNIIDVYHYRITTPIVIQEIGQVSYWRVSRPYRIKWLTGYNYIIDPNRVPPELMSMKPGQYIEATVKRHPVTHREIEIVSVRPISFRLPNDKEVQGIWDNMQIAELPEGGWD